MTQQTKQPLEIEAGEFRSRQLAHIGKVQSRNNASGTSVLLERFGIPAGK